MRLQLSNIYIYIYISSSMSTSGEGNSQAPVPFPASASDDGTSDTEDRQLESLTNTAIAQSDSQDGMMCRNRSESAKLMHRLSV